jgi:hypothetical protein
MRIKKTQQILAFFMIAIVLSIPFITADAVAISIVDSSVKGKNDGVPGYMDETGDSAIFEVTVSEEVEPEQVRIVGSDVHFTSCAEVLGDYVCTYEESFDFTRAEITVPVGVYQSDELYQFDFDPDDEVALSLATDVSDPSQPRMTVMQRQGGIQVYFMLEDEESGIKKFEIRSGSPEGTVEYVESLSQDESGAYPNTFEKYLNDPLLLNLASGDYTLFLLAYDAFGNTAVSAQRRVSVDTTPPAIGEWFIVPCNFVPNERSDYAQNSIKKIGADGRNACVHLLINEKPSNDWEVNATFTNFDRTNANTVGIPLSSTHEGCYGFGEDSYYCKFSYYDNEDPLFFANSAAGAYGVSASFIVADSAENIQTSGSGTSIEVVTEAPALESFTSPRVFASLYYGAQDAVTFTATFGSGEPLDPTTVSIDATRIGGSISVPADACDDHVCTWNVSGSFHDGTVSVVSAQDVLGNDVLISTVPESVKTLSLTIDTQPPHLVDIELSNPPEEGEWWKECGANGAGCSACKYDTTGTPTGTCDFTLWDYRIAYFETGGYLDVTVRFSDDLGGATAYIDTSTILEDGELTEADFCNDDDGNWSCTWESIGALLPSSNYFDLIIEDVGGSQVPYKIPFISYEYQGDEDIWSSVVSAGASPSNVSRDWMSLTQMRQTHILQFNPTSIPGTRTLEFVKPTCIPSITGLVDEIRGEWFGSQYFMEVLYESGDLTEESASLNCTLTTVTRIGSTLFSDEEEVILNLSFIDSPFGTPSDALEEEIEDLKEKWETYNNMWIPQLMQLIEITRNVCTATYTLFSVVPIFAWVLEAIGLKGSIFGITAGPYLAMEVTDQGAGALLKFIGPICDTVNCNWCNGGANADFNMPGEIRANFCKEGGVVSTYLDVFVNGIVYNILNADQWLADKLGAGEAYGEYVDGILGTNRALDTKNSIVLAVISVCPQDIIYFWEKKRQTDCRYIRCLEEDVAAGTATVNDCKIARGYELCTYAVGEIWSIIPLTNLIDAFGDMIEAIVTDPAMVFGLLQGATCKYVICNPAANPTERGCGICITVDHLGPMLETITNFFTQVFSGDEFDMFASLQANNDCEGIMDSPLLGGDEDE